ncbi:MAG: beta-N-acetylhexosaminidase [bacterium]
MKKKSGLLEMEMTPELMAGQMVMCGFSGKSLPPELGRELSSGLVSGVVLFEENLGGPEEVRDLTDEIRKVSWIPPFIAIDHEGGRVGRLRPPFTQWPSPRKLGKKDSGTVREVAGAMSAELLAAGINLNFMPVLDVDSNPDNPVIGDRSFGPDAARVGRLGAAMIEGSEQAGIISCGKHFPGHGHTSVDSHHDLPVVEDDIATLERRELRPFYEALRSKVPMIMTAHLKATSLDPYQPASISGRILRELLREEMGFSGVIVTDDLEMGALSKYMNLADAAFSAVRAGADLLLTCSGPESARQARQTIIEAHHHGALGYGELFLSVRRLLELKERYLFAALPPKRKLTKIIGSEAHQSLAERAAGGV